MTPRRLKNAPILEALIDLQVDPPLTVDVLARFGDSIVAEFPTREDRLRVPTNLELRPNTTVAQLPLEHCGYLFRSQDGRRIVQGRTDGFTLSHLKPYESWAALSKDTRVLWSKFVEHTRPASISRVALRYINELEFPLPITDIETYMKTHPVLAEGIPQGMTGSFMRLVVPDPITKAVAIITQAAQVPPKPGSGPLKFIFDVEVVTGAAAKPDDPGVWDLLDRIRDLKNSIFFGSLTDKALEQYA